MVALGAAAFALGVTERMAFPRFFVFQEAGFMLPSFLVIES